LHNGRHIGLGRVHIGLTLLDVVYSVRSSVNADMLLRAEAATRYAM